MNVSRRWFLKGLAAMPLVGALPSLAESDNTPLVDESFDQHFIRVNIDIVSADNVSFEHLMSKAPGTVMVHLVNKEPEHGYSEGDEIAIPLINEPGISSMVLVVDHTFVHIRYSSKENVFMGLNMNTGEPVGLTNSNWRLTVEVWA